MPTRQLADQQDQNHPVYQELTPKVLNSNFLQTLDLSPLFLLHPQERHAHLNNEPGDAYHLERPAKVGRGEVREGEAEADEEA